jgi:hypothetical protein
MLYQYHAKYKLNSVTYPDYFVLIFDYPQTVMSLSIILVLFSFLDQFSLSITYDFLLHRAATCEVSADLHQCCSPREHIFLD